MSYSPEFVNIYKEDGVHKEFFITIGDNINDEMNWHFFNGDIVDDSIELQQSIYDGTSLDICGCIASSFSCKLRVDINELIFYSKGAKITFDIQAGNTEKVRLFTGRIDSCEIEANRKFLSVNAYDDLYRLSGKSGIPTEPETKYNISTWFNEHSTTTIRNLLYDLLDKFDVPVSYDIPELINGSLATECGSKFKVSGISALDLLKDICRINACFGYIKGNGEFSVKYLSITPFDEIGQLYPSAFVFPSSDIWPGVNPDHAAYNDDNYLGSYESLKYQNFNVDPITRVVVADYEGDRNSATVGEGIYLNIYIIYGNLCMLKQSMENKRTAALRIYEQIKDIYYTPFEADGLGLPYLECGDEITFYDLSRLEYLRFYIFSRTMSIGQSMRDQYSADGDEYQHEFKVGSSKDTHEEEDQDISELEDRMDDAEDRLDSFDDKFDDLDDFVDEVEDYMDSGGGGIGDYASVISVSQLPAEPLDDTLYLVQGVVVMG